MTIIERDELGRIKKGGKKLSSEDARKIGSLPKGRKERKASAEQLLSEAGYDIDDAPEVVRILADHAQKSPAGMSLWLRATAQDESIDNTPVVQPGAVCPTCRQIMTDFTRVDQDELMDFIRQYRKDHQGEGGGSRFPKTR